MVNIKTKRFTFVAAIGACRATLISFALGFGRSVWFDEGYSIIVLDQPFDRMMALLKVDVHPPLYYLLLRGWTGIFGPSATSMRAMSCLFCGVDRTDDDGVATPPRRSQGRAHDDAVPRCRTDAAALRL